MIFIHHDMKPHTQITYKSPLNHSFYTKKDPMREEDSPSMDTLKELFPDVHPQRLLSLLQIHSGDVQRTTDYLLSSLPESTGYQLSLLFEIFAELDEDVVRKHYEECGRDTERTTEALLGFQTAKLLQEQLTLEDEQHKKTHSKNKIKWDSLDDKISTLAHYSGLSEKEAATYFHKNGGNICEALVDIVFHHKSTDDDGDEDHRPRLATVRATPKFLDHIGSGSGRVQSGPYNVKEVPAFSLSLKEKVQLLKRQCSQPSTASSSSDTSTETDITEEEDYCFNDTNPEVEELANTVVNNDAFVEISWSFYKNAITLFKGNTDKVIELAIFILENDAASMTYRDVNKALDYSQLFAHIKSSPAPSLPSISYASVISEHEAHNFTPVVKRRVQTYPIGPETDTEVGFDRQQIVLQRNALKSAVQKNVLDLHNFNVLNAKATAGKALDKWWNDELQAREVDGRNTRSTKAYMIPPLIIVTGRGIHSDGGKSKIRHSIKTMLEKGPFKYEEEASRFIIVGRKIGM